MKISDFLWDLWDLWGLPDLKYWRFALGFVATIILMLVIGGIAGYAPDEVVIFILGLIGGALLQMTSKHKISSKNTEQKND